MFRVVAHLLMEVSAITKLHREATKTAQNETNKQKNKQKERNQGKTVTALLNWST